MLARLRRHADNDVPAAVAALGQAYSRGDYGLVKSDKKALKLFQRAADLGDVFSCASVGDYYFDGRGVKSDRKKAARFYRIGAENGEPWAQNHLAQCYELGAGVPRDLDEAKRLFALAAAQGLQYANAQLQRFSNAP